MGSVETDNLRQMNVEVKPSRLLDAGLAYRGLRYACPRLPTSASDVYCPPGKASLFVIPVCDLLELGFIFVYVVLKSFTLPIPLARAFRIIFRATSLRITTSVTSV